MARACYMHKRTNCDREQSQLVFVKIRLYCQATTNFLCNSAKIEVKRDRATQISPTFLRPTRCSIPCLVCPCSQGVLRRTRVLAVVGKLIRVLLTLWVSVT